MVNGKCLVINTLLNTLMMVEEEKSIIQEDGGLQKGFVI